MPTDGPVREPQVSVPTDDVPGISFDPRPPRAGESPVDIVEDFLEAMKATPISLTVARQFLSEEAADAWEPEEQVITYGEPGAGLGRVVGHDRLKDVNVSTSAVPGSAPRPAATSSSAWCRRTGSGASTRCRTP